jgi:D-alanyl-D-alanine carboxypeptidase/D-alanyl-D-alanine-endopeptidase (penicillin-binding protein 4)
MALALVSMDSPPARSQGTDPAGDPAVPTSNGVEDVEDPASPTGISPEPPAIPDVPLPADRGGRTKWLTGKAGALVDDRARILGTARVGVVIADATTGEPLYQRDPGGRYNLASVTKLITTGAALARLGPGFRWRTAIYAERFDVRTGEVAGDLFVRGRGDPTLDAAAVRGLAADLRQAGVRLVRGSLVLDGSYFDGVTEPPHFAEQPLERAGFRAPIGAFAVNGNTVTLEAVPDPAGSGAAAVTMTPPAGDYVAFSVAEVLTTARGRSRVRVETRTEKAAGGDRIRIAVSGQLRFDEGIWSTRRRVDDPVRFAGEALRTAMAAQGIKVTGREIKRGLVPRTVRQLASHDSPPLVDIAREMNKSSNNFVAETLLKTLGAETRAVPGPATWDDGLAAVRRWLIDDVGLTEGSFRVGNGSGLFGASDFTPAQVAQIMTHAYRDFRIGPELMSTLAVAGVDGTLWRRFAASAGRGRIRAKTGTLESASTLAGYVAVDGRRPLAFAILVNDIPLGQRGHARALQDALLEACIAFLDAT